MPAREETRAMVRRLVPGTEQTSEATLRSHAAYRKASSHPPPCPPPVAYRALSRSHLRSSLRENPPREVALICRSGVLGLRVDAARAWQISRPGHGSLCMNTHSHSLWHDWHSSPRRPNIGKAAEGADIGHARAAADRSVYLRRQCKPRLLSDRTMYGTTMHTPLSALW